MVRDKIDLREAADQKLASILPICLPTTPTLTKYFVQEHQSRGVLKRRCSVQFEKLSGRHQWWSSLLVKLRIESLENFQ